MISAHDQKILKSLPEPPEFEAYQSPFPPHLAVPIIPPSISFDPKPLDLFSLFFTDDILAEIVANTNRYAEIKRSGNDSFLPTISSSTILNQVSPLPSTFPASSLHHTQPASIAQDPPAPNSQIPILSQRIPQLPHESLTSGLPSIGQSTASPIGFSTHTPITGSKPSETPSQLSSRPWHPVSISEIRIFIALQIWMGVNSLPAIDDYWKSEMRNSLMEFMSCNRYQQIKRYLHVSPPDETYDRANWWRKMEPLASHLRECFQEHYLPASNVSFDEMMVLCKGRSAHTIKLPGKPIDQGYKIYALCDQGYTYTFMFYSGVSGNEASDFTRKTEPLTQISTERSLALLNSKQDRLTKEQQKKLSQGFSPTTQVVCRLVFSLPFQSHQFNVYMDNYFTSIPLFQHLRDHGIGAAGTTRTKRHNFPSELTISKDITSRILEWNHLSGVVVNGVCAALWQDNNTVHFLTTIHDLRQLVLSNRKRPKKTSTNAAAARKPFADDEHQKLLPIPALVSDYNQHMGGVDVADQLRSNYTCHQVSRRNWLPLWFWALDTTITNAYLIARSLCPKYQHKLFRKELAFALAEASWAQLHPLNLDPKPQSKSYITIRTSLPPLSFRSTGTHQQSFQPNKKREC